jgi:hypothetical protein
VPRTSLHRHLIALLAAALLAPSAGAEYLTTEELQQKAAAGDAEAQFKLGERYYFGNEIRADRALAVEWFTKAAEQNHGKAAYKLFQLYDAGIAVRRDQKKALDFLRLAAGKGRYDEAMVTLGLRMSNGTGVPQDHAAAARVYQRAADLGNPRGQGLLAASYLGGRGVVKDYVRAYQWGTLALEGGDPRARSLIDLLDKDLDDAGKQKALALVEKWRAEHPDVPRPKTVAVPAARAAPPAPTPSAASSSAPPETPAVAEPPDAEDSPPAPAPNPS